MSCPVPWTSAKMQKVPSQQQVPAQSSRAGHRHSLKMHGETKVRHETVTRGPRAAAQVCQAKNEQNLDRGGESAPDFI